MFVAPAAQPEKSVREPPKTPPPKDLFCTKGMASAVPCRKMQTLWHLRCVFAIIHAESILILRRNQGPEGRRPKREPSPEGLGVEDG